jgi:hypothetical protein
VTLSPVGLSPHARFDRRMLQVAGIWNWTIALGFALAEPLMRQIMQVKAAAGLDPVVAHLFYALVFALGVGYFVAAEDPRGNRGILWAGAIAKIAVFFIVGAHVWAGDAGFAAMGAPIGDAVFAVLFLRILMRPAN